uniref:L27-1 domain-containing protein n=1 Tax=Echeneis naucrates TaxID=173247 RepID=A0A665U8D6_ECHNA
MPYPLIPEYCTKLRRPEEQQLKSAIQRVMGIFKSNLFEALLGKSSLWSYSHSLSLLGQVMLI